VTRLERTPEAGPGAAWFLWAVGIGPAMFLLGLFLFPNVFSTRRLLQILWAAGLLLALLAPRIRHGSARLWSSLSPPVRSAAAVLVAGALASAVLSAAPSYAMREWGLLTLLLITVLPAAVILSGRQREVLAVLAATLVLYAVLRLPAPLETGFGHPRFLGQAMAVAAPPLLFSGSPWLALAAAPALALGIVNGSRALLLTILVVTVAALVLWPDRRRRMLPGMLGVVAAALIVAALAAMGYDASLQDAVERGATLTGRERIWTESLARFLQAPVLGEGPGMLARSPGLGGWAAHPHNSVLLIAAETGLVGLVSVGLLVGRGLWQLPRLPADRRPWALALLSGGFHSLLSGTIVMPASQSLLVLALAMALPRPDEGDTARPLRPAVGLALAVVGAAALVVLVATIGLPPADTERVGWGPRFFARGIIP
jgi:O-antigen ligase